MQSGSQSTFECDAVANGGGYPKYTPCMSVQDRSTLHNGRSQDLSHMDRLMLCQRQIHIQELHFEDCRNVARKFPSSQRRPVVQFSTNEAILFMMLYCSKNVITSRISSSDKYQQVILGVRWGECSPIVEDIMKVLAPSGLSR